MTRPMTDNDEIKSSEVPNAKDEETTLSRILEFRDESSKLRSKTPIPFVLEKQPNTPRTKAVKNMVSNANKGYKNPLDKNLFHTADQYCKSKDARIREDNKKKHEKPEYLYKQVKNGVNVWLRQPYPINVIAGLQKTNQHETRQSAKQRKAPEKLNMNFDLEVKRQKNQNAFLSYVQEAQQKKQINQEISMIQVHLNMLEQELKRMNNNEAVATESRETVENVDS